MILGVERMWGLATYLALHTWSHGQHYWIGGSELHHHSREGPRSKQLAPNLKSDIHEGHYEPGTSLPSTRTRSLACYL